MNWHETMIEGKERPPATTFLGKLWEKVIFYVGCAVLIGLLAISSMLGTYYATGYVYRLSVRDIGILLLMLVCFLLMRRSKPKED